MFFNKIKQLDEKLESLSKIMYEISLNHLELIKMYNNLVDMLEMIQGLDIQNRRN